MAKTSRFAAHAASPLATPADVDAAYRHYLGREPDADGARHWYDTLDELSLTVDRLDSLMIASEEFHHRPEAERLQALAGLGRGEPRVFPLNRIETVGAALHVGGFRETVQAGHFALPDNFDRTLDPDGDAYREQMVDLWRAITGREDYDPRVDEDTPEVADLDFVRRPAFYALGDALAASEHVLALGHVLRFSQAKAGDRVLEYGAGFGQIALAFARLGCRVDTVDINPAFSAGVTSLGRRYKVKLTGHVGQFGDNPAGEPHAYDLIYFYESFHHCLEFRDLIPRLATLLKPGGRILMAGEPIVVGPSRLMPYSWGIRMDAENVAIMRQRGWMELGFREHYLMSKFADAGYWWMKRPVADFHYATLYEFGQEDALAAG